MRTIYLDYAATTPMRPEVRDAMAPYLSDRYGNASSPHRYGREARTALEESRERIAHVLGAARREIVFTSGGTEADNLAVLGRWRSARRKGARSVVCSAVEHKAVLGAAAAAAAEGCDVVELPVDEHGRVVDDALDVALHGHPAVVSVMWANNEVGTVQPVARIAGRCRESDVPFHSDAVQAFGRQDVRVDVTPCGLLTLSAHKIGGPKGMGALFVREGLELEPLIHGGGQERGLRPGTEPVAAAVGFAVAAELAVAERAAEAARLTALRDRLAAGLEERIAGLEVNGRGAERVPHLLNVSMDGVDQEALLIALDLEGIAVSSGAACQSGSVEPSHVLSAMGRQGRDTASLRISLGRETTEEEVRGVIDALPGIVARLRELGGR